MCVCVCVCVCVYVCMYVCMYVCVDGWMDGWMDGCWRYDNSNTTEYLIIQEQIEEIDDRHEYNLLLGGEFNARVGEEGKIIDTTDGTEKPENQKTN